VFARFLALFAILSTYAAARDYRAGAISIYLKTGAADAAAVTYMKGEVAYLMQSAGFTLEWLDASAGTPGVRDSQLVVLELEGACASDGGVPVGASAGSLASTAVSDGRILPFSTVHCNVLNRILGPAIAGESAPRRDWLYGRALARIAAHEIYHVLTEAAGHSRAGIAKAAFSARDLLAGRFEFEGLALAKLRTAGMPGATF
jgi:hypothetical protein